MSGTRKLYCHGIKRILAVVLSMAGLICFSWLYLILAIVIKIDSPGPVAVPAEPDRHPQKRI